MAFDEFRCVVIGNEPAGLWLLSQMEKAHRELGEEPRLGWVSLGGDPAPLSLSVSLGSAFGIAPGASWSAEILTPQQSVAWTIEKVAEKFPELPPIDSARHPLDSLTHPSAPDLAALRGAISRRPELIGFAQGLWKALGRTQQQTPESLVHFSRYLTQLQWWTPERELSDSIQRISLDATENRLEGYKQRKPEGFSMQFRHFGEITSQRWIFNMDMRSLMALARTQKDFLQLLNLHWDPAALQALYPLRLLVEPEAIPSPVSPLTLVFDTELIPDPQTEIWPIHLRPHENLRELTLWASAPGLVSLEAVLEALGNGLARAHQLFPFLSQKTAQFSVPLGMDSCFEEEQRRQVADGLQWASIEKYNQTGFYTETRSRALSLLFPYMGCHLPYPIGSLMAARKILDGVSSKKKKPTLPGNLEGQPNAG